MLEILIAEAWAAVAHTDATPAVAAADQHLQPPAAQLFGERRIPQQGEQQLDEGFADVELTAGIEHSTLSIEQHGLVG